MGRKKKELPHPQSVVDFLIDMKWVDEIVHNLQPNWEYIDDLQQELWLIILDQQKDKLQEIYDRDPNQLKFYLCRIACNMWRSNTSPFYRTFRKFKDTASSEDLKKILMKEEMDDNNNSNNYDD